MLIHVFGQVSLSRDSNYENMDFTMFAVDEFISLSYEPFYDDFGPLNLGAIYEFCESLELEIKRLDGKQIAVVSNSTARAFTNAALLLGAYMIMKLNTTPDLVEKTFEPVHHFLLSYRDVSPGEQNFSLYVRDCWAGLWKAKSLSWVDFGPDGFDREDYMELDSPVNADLHVVVPGKFIAMRGPKDFRDGVTFKDTLTPEGHFSHRDFSPAHYADILAQFDVTAVVRLNAREYEAAGFRAAGIAVADLCFDDCTAPPVEVVAQFLALAEGLPGALAVHCKAGLGRTGTLIALYMMKHHGFTAREAMGWLRIVRPGSVIGPQQQFLCDKEALMHECGAAYRRRGRGRYAPAAAGAGLAAVEEYVAGVSQDMRARAAGLATTVQNMLPHPVHASYPADAGESRGGDEGSSQGEVAARLAAHVSAAGERRSGRRSSLSAATAAADTSAFGRADTG